MNAIPQPTVKRQEETSASLCDEQIDLDWTEPELLMLWMRAAETQNERLADSILTTRRLSSAHLPAACALLIDSRSAAGAGLSFTEWLQEIGGWTPGCEYLTQRNAWPAPWYASDDAEGITPQGIEPMSVIASYEPTAIVTRRELAKIFSVSERTITRRISEAGFPPPHHRGRELYWLAGELREVKL